MALGSRSGILAVLVSAAIQKRLLHRKFAIPILALGILLIVIKWHSFTGRLFIWKICLENTGQYWFSGTGSNTFNYWYSNWQHDYFLAHPEWTYFHKLADCPSHPYNEFLNIFVEYGIVGLAVLLAAFVLPAIKWRQSVRDSQLAVHAGLMTFFVFSMVYDPFTSFLARFVFAVHIGVLLVPRQQVLRLCWLILFVVLGYTTVSKEMARSKANTDWETGELLSMTDPSQAEVFFNKAEPVLFRNRFFAESHSRNLLSLDTNLALRYLYSNIHLNQYQSHMMIAGVYQLKNIRSVAIKHFTEAHYIIPNRFIPMYHLYLLAKDAKDSSQAEYWREKVRHTPVKIPSKQIEYIKLQMDL